MCAYSSSACTEMASETYSACLVTIMQNLLYFVIATIYDRYLL